MNLVSLFTPLLAISILIERVLEAAFSLVESFNPVLAWKQAHTDQYSKNKQMLSIVIGIFIGIFLANWLGVALFAQFGLQGIDANADRVITGAIAGAAAPYSHQIIELLFNLQKLFGTKKKEIAVGTAMASAAPEVNP